MRALYRGSLLLCAQGPCGHLSDTPHYDYDGLRANGRTNLYRKTTATDSIYEEGLYRAYFDGFVARAAREDVACKIENLLARVDEFCSESTCTSNSRHRGEIRVGLFFWSDWFVDNLLLGGQVERR